MNYRIPGIFQQQSVNRGTYHIPGIYGCGCGRRSINTNEDWILATGYWADGNYWRDIKFWID